MCIYITKVQLHVSAFLTIVIFRLYMKPYISVPQGFMYNLKMAIVKKSRNI